MNNEVLTWEIIPSEKRGQIKNFISKTWLVLIGLVIFSLFYYVSDFFSWALREGIKPALLRVVYVAIGVVAFIALFFLLNKFIPYRLRTYRLDDAGIAISKGKKKKYFSWKEFECFYPYRSYQSYPSYPGESMRGQLFEAGQQIEGQIFYLKKKSIGFFSKLCRIFVVVYSEPDNSKAASKFLSKHLPSRKMTSSTDLGLVFYQFK
jgi:hypothetical protein